MQEAGDVGRVLRGRRRPDHAPTLVLEAEAERFQRQLLGDVEVEPATGVLDELGGAARRRRVEALGGGAQLRRAGRG